MMRRKMIYAPLPLCGKPCGAIWLPLMRELSPKATEGETLSPIFILPKESPYVYPYHPSEHLPRL